MIVLQNMTETNNIIHLIIGPQTNFQFDMSGALEVDIQKMIDQFPNKNLPIKLVITRSLNESETASILSAMTAARGSQEYSIPENDNSNSKSNVMKNLLKMLEEEKKKQNNKVGISGADDPRGLWEPRLICPKCYNKGVFLKQGNPPLCADCLKIEKGIGNVVRKSKKSTKPAPNKETESGQTELQSK